jgi:two-component system chemotaxis response regulator CheY
MALILLVDDEPDVRLSIEAILNTDHLVLSVASGEDALSLVGKVKPELSIFDISLGAGMSGIELCRICTATPALSGMPILAISGHTDIKGASDIMQAGATSFLAKPFKPEILLKTVNDLIGSERDKLTRLIAGSSEDNLFQATIEAAMIGSAYKITRALERAVKQIKDNLGK